MARRLPTFTTNTQYFGDGAEMPHIITIRPLTVGGANADFSSIMRSIAATIRDSISREVRQYTGWSSYRVNRQVRGRLIATNDIGGSVHGFTSQFTTISEITRDAIYSVFESIQQSNVGILITDIEWSFHIDPNSIAVGGAQKVKVPEWIGKLKYRNTWVGHDDVNCAAFSICYLLYATEKRYDKNIKKAIEDAKKLQEELEWEGMISVKELEKFIEKYPKFRLTTFLPHAVQTPFTYTGSEWEYQERTDLRCPDNCLYLVYDAVQKHFGATKSPAEILKKIHNNTQWAWCHKCVQAYTQEHTCIDDHVKKKKKIIQSTCLKCGVVGKHTCPLITCKTCSSLYKREEGFDHRCIVYKEPRTDSKNIFIDDPDKADGKFYALWVYDFESRVKIEDSVRSLITEFKMEGNHYLEDPEDDVRVYDFKVQKHEVNFVAFKNVFTDEEKTFFGENALQDFILFMLEYNRGKNICIAHNAAGYDTRLLFSKAKDLQDKVEMAPIMRGGKFMQLTLNRHTIFRDSLLHVKGSLKALAKDFCDGILEKGYFPHLFNTIENYNYIGPLPDKKYFDLSFSCRSEKEIEDFNEWYDSWTGDWNFMNELKKYCINDVLVLQKIVKGYHDIAFSKFKMSPWFNATAPSFVHDVFITKLGFDLELPDRKENPDEYRQKIIDLAWNDYWAVLKPNEYWFARKALRGGRTEIRKIYHKVEQNDWDRGVRIRYQDICSQYPYQQVVHDFPVGLPTIHLWDKKYTPCIEHQNNQDVLCNCARPLEDRFCKIVHPERQWTETEIINDSKFFGIICATVDPPKDMYHPVLVAFDQKLNKSVAACERIVEGCFTSIEFVTALKNGYKIIEIHRYDQYNKKPSLWKDIVLDLFLEKMINSKNMPSNEECQKLIKDYGDLFGEDFADKIYDSFKEGKWGKNPAKKQTAKIMMNSAWGKHAQRPIMPEAAIFDFEDDQDAILNFFENCTRNNYEYHDGIYLNKNQIMYKYSISGKNTRPDLHGGYLPAALFVPAYGRMQLWEELNKLGKRVLMNDTDSIVYIYDPDLYNIPEGGLLGQWEVEDIDSKNGGIREFVGLGPKTYGILCDNGYSMVKAKGLSLNLATEKLVNFETMRDAAISRKVIKVPQKTFVWNIKEGMKNWLMLKDLKMNENDMKGLLDENGYLYPFGYSE